MTAGSHLAHLPGRYRACLSLIYREGIRNGKVSFNPARLVKQRTENNARTRFLTIKEIASLPSIIQEHYPHHVPAFDVAVHTGIRLGEQFRLVWSDVHIGRKQIVCRDTKNGTSRIVPLNRSAVSAFLEARKQWDGNPSSRVFQSVYGKGLNNPRKWYVPAVELSKLKDVLWHTLRHTFISHLVMSGVDIRTVAQLAGHKTLSQTMRYAHLAPGHLQEAVERLDQRDTTSDTGTFTNHSHESHMRSNTLN